MGTRLRQGSGAAEGKRTEDGGQRTGDRRQGTEGLLLPAGRPFQQAAQSLRRLVAVQFAAGEVEHQFLPLLAVGRRLDSIQSQENNPSHHGGALVAIKKWMIAAKIICARDFHKVGVGRLAAKGGLRSKNSGGEQVPSRTPCNPPNCRSASAWIARTIFDREMNAVVRCGLYASLRKVLR